MAAASRSARGSGPTPPPSPPPLPSRPFAEVIGDWPALAAAAMTGDGAPPARAGLCALAQTTPVEGLRDAFEKLAGDDRLPGALAAAIHNGLARACLLTGETAAARAHLALALALGFDDGAPVSATEIEARRVEQCRQLGIAAVWAPDGSAGDGTGDGAADEAADGAGDGAEGVPVPATVRTDAAFRDLARLAPDDPVVTLALAEGAQAAGDPARAVGHWQDLAARLGPAMPQGWYDRLAAAQTARGPLPPGTPDEERRRGALDRYQALALLHRLLAPRLYLEIGVQAGRSLRLATGPAIGIDPMPMLRGPLPETARLYRMSSDAFFAGPARTCLAAPPDLVFIDGLHLFEFVLRDFIHVEACAGPGTVVVIDDIFPNHPAQAARTRRTRNWTGDVWKLHRALQGWRPDLQLLTIDADPTGLLLVRGLDPANRVLAENHDRILAAFPPEAAVPQETLDRAGVDVASLSELEARLRDPARAAAG